MKPTELAKVLMNRGLTIMRAGDHIHAMDSFVTSHHVALAARDEMGARFSVEFLKRAIRMSQEKQDPDELSMIWTRLVSSMGGLCNEGEEEAWANFYEGAWCLEHDMVEHGLSCLIGCLEKPLAELLKYLVSGLLGETYELLLENASKAVEFYQMQRDAAFKLENHYYQVMALSNLAISLVIAGFHAQACEAQRALQESVAGNSDSADYLNAFAKGMEGKLLGTTSWMSSQYSESVTANKRASEILVMLGTDDEAGIFSKYLFSREEVSIPPDMVIRINKSIIQAWYEIGHSHLQLGELSAATEAFLMQKSLAESKSNGFQLLKALEGLATASLAKQDYEEAQEYTTELLQNLAADAKLESGKQYFTAVGLFYCAQIAYKLNEDHLDEHIVSCIQDQLSQAETVMSLTSDRKSLGVILNFHGVFSMEIDNLVQAIEKFELQLVDFLQMEHHFGTSIARISSVDDVKHAFRYLQLVLSRESSRNVKRAVVWAERERARDLLYGISKAHGDAYLKGLYDFDVDDEEAWEEVTSALDLAGTDTVFLLCTRTDDDFLTYFLHATDEPKAYICMQKPGVVSIFDAVHRTLEAIKERQHDELVSLLEYFHEVLIRPWSEELARIEPKKLVFVPTELFGIQVDETKSHS